MFKFFTRKSKQIHALFTIFLLLFQNFAPLFFLVPTAKAQTNVNSVALSFDSQSNQLTLSGEAAEPVEYLITYDDNDETTPADAITGLTNLENNKFSTDLFVGTCSTDDSCTKDTITNGKLSFENTSYEASFEIKDGQLWLKEGNIFKTTGLKTGQAYVAPQNNQVTITFTKLPENAGNLMIEEILLSEEQVAALGATSNIAYDITSNMENGSFEYNLTLPVPENIEGETKVVFAESVSELAQAQEVTSEVVSDDQVKAEGLDHFTVFVVVVPKEATSLSGGENLPGWMFNRDPSTSSPYEFNSDQSSIGTGSLYVFPIGGNASDKFIAEYFIKKQISEINRISYDFLIGNGGTPAKANHFYMNVYANFAESDDNKFYDCRYSVVPTSGSNSNFTTVIFDPNQSYAVTKSNSSPQPTCPNIPANMGTGAKIRVVAINVGDTSTNDAGLNGYLDNVVVETTTNTTIFDFEPGLTDVHFGQEVAETYNNSSRNGIYSCTAKDHVFTSQNIGGKSRQVLEWTPIPGAQSYQFRSFKWNGTSWSPTGSTVNISSIAQYTVAGYDLTRFNNTSGFASYTELDTANNVFRYVTMGTSEGTYTRTVKAFSGSNGTGSLIGETEITQEDLLSGGSHKNNYDVCSKLTIDRTAPSTPILESPANNSSQAFNNFYFEWSDVAEAVRYEIQFSQSRTINSNGSFINVDWSGDSNHNQPTESRAWSSGANGTWYWQVRSVDGAGNMSGWTAPWKLTIDMTAPTQVTLNSPANGAFVSGNPQQKWNATPDTHHYEYESYNNPLGTGPAIYATTVNGTTRTVGGNQNITFWWRVRAVDAVGNKDQWSDLWKITVDNTNPTSTNDLSDIVTGEVVITQQVNDTNPKSGKLRIWKLVGGVPDNSQFFAIGDINVDSEGKIIYNLDTVGDLYGDGEYVAKFTATDLAGNQSLVQKNFTVDNTVPSSIITNYNLADGGSIETNEFTGLIEGTATDLTSGISHVLLSISHLDFGADESETTYWDATASAWVATESMFSATGTNVWNYQLTDVPNGIYNITSHAVDNAGNVENTYNIRIVYDKTIPEVALTINPTLPDGDNGWYRYTKPTITLTASDNYNLDHIEYQWNSTSGTWTTYINPFVTPSEGQNILYYRSIDSVGNVSEPGIKEVKYDKTNPAGEPLEVKVDNVTSNTADATWKKPTDDSDVSHYRVVWRHENGTEYSVETGKDDFAHQLDKLFNGLWTLTVQAVDSAGNFTEKKTDFRVGPGPGSSESSTGGSVLGATTSTTNGTAPFITQTSVDDEEATTTSDQGSNTTSNQPEGAVLGATTCNGLESYLPIILLVTQLLVLLAVEVLNRDAGVGKLVASIAITVAMIPLYYLLRNPDCFTQGSGLDVINNWFAGITIATGLAAKLIGKSLFEEK